MVRPERRTKVDLLAVALITVAAVVVGATLWHTGDLRATTLRTASEAAVVPAAPSSLPPSLGEVWSEPSPATDHPAVAGPSVVVGAEGTVRGLDPFSGAERWSYRRDLPLCTVGAAWDRAVTVYRKTRNCSEVTSLEGDTGQRGPQRNTDAEVGTRLIGDGTYLAAVGERLTEVWGSNLVRTLQYGEVPAPVNPERQPRTDCDQRSFATGNARLAVIERCGDDTADRLTVLLSRPDDDDEPEEVFSVSLDEQDATLVAVTDAHAVIATVDPPRIITFDSDGTQVGELPLADGEVQPTAQARRIPLTTTTDHQTFWYTGTSTIALSNEDASVQWTMPGTLGSGTLFAGSLLVPVPDGLAVLDPTSGDWLGELPVDRGGYSDEVTMDSIGPMVLEQRGDTLVALR
ncbi:Rv3212 family protein [Actinoalloteichus hymeniacidonis]|uniref:PQQ-like domain n=1 Tax=Actinoalloteichus hymeniacidonis TaxID=340345 RepID=A0AAC9HMB5_9PSEU|nr:hypothetical protein [Actinoalloteichus hymeniacidonis]AOS61781.1 hypothetical protein TL08_04755 [Actinoalloteichus hymeniacidonis]MBB5910200.1 hypothetical protein [Actinoalloteichus hymeniacidonis]